MLRILLRAYPKRFRDLHGEEVLRLCRDVYGPGFSLRAAADLLWNGACERLGAAPASFEDWLEQPRLESSAAGRLAGVVRDVRAGMRRPRASPGVTVAIVLTLALG